MNQHHQPQWNQNYPGYQYPAPQPPKKKRRVFPMLAGLFVGALLLLVIGAALGGGSNGGGGQGAPVVTEAGAPADVLVADKYTLVAESQRGDHLLVTYSNGKGGMNQSPVNSGWRTEVPREEGFASGVFTVSSPGINSKPDTVRCKVLKGSEVVAESEGSGSFASATCGPY